MTVARRFWAVSLLTLGLLVAAGGFAYAGVSQVTLTLGWSSTPPTTASTLSLIVGLAPADAYGDVALYDNGTLIDQGHNYRQQWSALLSGLRAGTHTLRLVFTPDASTGYSASDASTTFTVLGPPSQGGGSPSPVPSPSPTATVIIVPPQTKAGGGVSPSPSPSTGVVSHSRSTSKTLPFTGAPIDEQFRFALASLLAGGLIVACAAVRVGRRQA